MRDYNNGHDKLIRKELDMKYLLIALFSINISFGQVGIISNELVLPGDIELRKDFNSDGKTELLHALSIIKINENTYRVRDGQFINNDRTMIIDFKEILLVNNAQYIGQVKAKYGYIIQFPQTKYVSIYISDEFGRIDSDELILKINQEI